MKLPQTRMQAAVLALAAILPITAIHAQELWDPHLRGVNEGLAAGVLPPKGVYGVLNNYWTWVDKYDNNGNKTGLRVRALIELPEVLWSTGLKVFGADYAVAIAQPVDYTTLSGNGIPANGGWGSFNTILVPGQLSWTLPNNLHLKTSLAVYLPNGSSSPGRLPSGTYLGAANGFWTLQPGVALSWLHAGWNLSMDATYAYNFRNPDTHYQSGQQLAIDYTAARTIGNWTLGLGGYQENQLGDDSGSGAAACGHAGGCRASNYGIGPLLGYQFGKLKLMAIYNFGLQTRNDVGGNFFNLRLSFPFQ
ncbi:transporter [Chromobacterium sp. ASV23]|uniref:SphA family protein n=1 Tax=Chromobacterium sp. ASV23 TaxID=2795110 RepID=UPI0018EAEBEB|nr:transporter [Chromobacterium sp. ASV23]